MQGSRSRGSGEEPTRDPVAQKLGEWTRGLDALEARTAVFTHVRDMPYEIIAELKDPVEGPARTLKARRGSCSAKHFLLGAMFDAMDIPVRYITFPFYWDDPDIDYPPHLRELAQRLPVEYHVANEAFLDGKWVLVDATWDPPLAAAGYPVNGAWDGVSNTLNAVKPLDEIAHASAVERAKFENEAVAAYTEEEKSALDEFVASLNGWLRELRGED
ncbi:MAG: transglutaminase domain-containing protein [Actinobacteria bacterium]|nr:transglutaminase domain-containing protein [Actinomycetota bacterium]